MASVVLESGDVHLGASDRDLNGPGGDFDRIAFRCVFRSDIRNGNRIGRKTHELHRGSDLCLAAHVLYAHGKRKAEVEVILVDDPGQIDGAHSQGIFHGLDLFRGTDDVDIGGRQRDDCVIFRYAAAGIELHGQLNLSGAQDRERQTDLRILDVVVLQLDCGKLRQFELIARFIQKQNGNGYLLLLVHICDVVPDNRLAQLCDFIIRRNYRDLVRIDRNVLSIEEVALLHGALPLKIDG